MTKLIIWFSALAAALFALTNGLANTYPFPRLDAFSGWLHNSDAITVVFTTVRAISIAVVIYLLATSAFICLTTTKQWRVARFVRRISLPAVNNLVVKASGVGVATALVLQANPANAAQDIEVPVLRHLVPGESMMTTTTTTTMITPTTIAPSVVEEPQQETAGNEYVVKRGDNLWTIAHDSLSTQLQRNPTEKELSAYWQKLIDVNRHRLTNPANPDLLFAGQTLELPAPYAK